MAVTSDMNIVLGQGSAVKEVYNVKKQNLELNQQFVAQETDQKKKEDKFKIQESEPGDRAEIKEDEEKENKKDLMDSKQDKKESKNKGTKEESSLAGGRLIDIRV